MSSEDYIKKQKVKTSSKQEGGGHEGNMSFFIMIEVMETGPEFSVVDHKLGLAPFFAEIQFLPDIFIIVEREALQF
jgi:hypothetical protein